MSATAIIAPLSRGASGLGAFPTSYEADLAISKVTVGTSTDRDNLPVWKRLSNMECYVIGDNKTYRLGSDTTIAGQVWTEVTFGIPADVVTESELFDTNGYIKPQYIQNIFLNTNFVVPDEPSQLALTTFTGNFVIRTDTGDVWIKLNNTNPALITDFALATPSASVISVNGQTGIVNITIANLLADSTNLTNFNTAVSNNSTVLGHSASIASINSSITTINSSLTALSTYVDQHIAGKDLDGTVTSPGSIQDGMAIVWDNALNKYKLSTVSGGGGGATTFTGLLDVPNTYSGQALKIVRVNAAETALEFVTPIGSLATLNDVSLSSLSDGNFLQYRTSDSKWHNSTMSGDVTVSNTGATTVGWANGYTTYDARYLKVSGGTLTGNLILNADPVSSLGAATKNYVDNAITGLTWKAAAQVATAGLNITLSGLQVIDGYTTLVGDRVLVKDQSIQTQNGLYSAAVGSWTRTSDADTGIEILGSTMYIENGTLNGGTQWNNNNSSITLGSTNITFVQIAGAGVYTNGTGLSLIGNVFSISASYVGQSSITTLGTIASGTWQATKIGLLYGGTNADLSGTGGASQVLRQSSTGAAITVSQLSYSDISGTVPQAYLLASGGVATGSNTFTFNTANWANFSSTWGATANNQYAYQFSSTLTARNSASDSITANYFKSKITATAATQDIVGITIEHASDISGSITTIQLFNVNTSSGCTNGTYTNVTAGNFTNTDGLGAGTGALWTVTVSGNTISSITNTNGGSGYRNGDVFSFNGSQFGGSGVSQSVAIIGLSQSLGTNASAFRIISQQSAGAYVTGSKFFDYQQKQASGIQSIFSMIQNSSGITFNYGTTPAFSFNNTTFSILIPSLSLIGVSANTYTVNSNPVVTGTIYRYGTSTANYIITSNSATQSTFGDSFNIRTGYPNGKTITGGSGYTNGTYNGTFAITGGTGSGATASQVIVSGGAVTSVTFTTLSQTTFGYKVGDVLTIANTSIGGTGSGFSMTLTSIDFTSGVFNTVLSNTTISDVGSANNYIAFNDTRTVNQQTGSTGYIATLEDNRTITAAQALYFIRGRVTTALSGVGLGSNAPTAMWDIRGNNAGTPTLNTLTTWTANANNQKVNTFTSTLTSRATASDGIVDNYFTTTINIMSTNIDAVGAVIDYKPVMIGGVATFSGATSTVAGMTATTYTNVAPASTSGSGTGALFTVVVTNATTISTVTVTTAGSGYKNNDTFTFNGSQFGSGSGSYTTTILTVTGVSLGANSSPLRIINRSPNPINGTATNRMIHFVDQAGVDFGSINIGYQGGNGASIVFFDPGGKFLTSSSTAGVVFSRNVIISGTLTSSGYTNQAQYSSTWATMNPSAGNFVTGAAYVHNAVWNPSFVVANSVGSSFSSVFTATTGQIKTLNTLVAGSGYTNGTYTTVPTTGGTGSNATLTVTVSGGVVTVATLTAGGFGYLVGDVISVSAANLGGTGSGFSITVATVDVSGATIAGYVYAPSQTSASSNWTFAGFYGTPTYNLTNQFTGMTVGFYWNPTMTANVGSRYGVLINSALDLSGFGTLTPKVTVDIAGGIALRATSPVSIGSSQNDYAIGAGTFFKLTASTPVNITGFTGGFDGKIMIIRNIGSNAITITNEDAASAAANRITSSTGANIVLNAKGSIVLVYDATATRWLDFALR